jgi:hypothetical protein
MADSAIIPDTTHIATHNSLPHCKKGRAVFTERAGEGSHRPPCATSMHRFPAEMR